MEVTISCDTLKEFNSTEIQEFVRKLNLLLAEYNNNPTAEEPTDLFVDPNQWLAYIRFPDMLDNSFYPGMRDKSYYPLAVNGYIDQTSAVVHLVRKLDSVYGANTWHCIKGKFFLKNSRTGDLSIGYVAQKPINPNAT